MSWCALINPSLRLLSRCNIHSVPSFHCQKYPVSMKRYMITQGTKEKGRKYLDSVLFFSLVLYIIFIVFFPLPFMPPYSLFHPHPPASAPNPAITTLLSVSVSYFSPFFSFYFCSICPSPTLPPATRVVSLDSVLFFLSLDSVLKSPKVFNCDEVSFMYLFLGHLSKWNHCLI